MAPNDDPSAENSFTVDDAYDLEPPDDNRRLYRKWAATYDRDFVAVF